MIRRELPLTNHASPAEPVAYFLRGFSFVLAPAAADLVLELNCVVQGCCFSLVVNVRDCESRLAGLVSARLSMEAG